MKDHAIAASEPTKCDGCERVLRFSALTPVVVSNVAGIPRVCNVCIRAFRFHGYRVSVARGTRGGSR